MLIVALASALSLVAAQLAEPAPWLSREAVLVASDAMTVDRAPMQVHRYRSRLCPEDVLALWSRAHPFESPQSRIAGDWRVVSRLQHTTQETLQVRSVESGGSEILLARVNLRAPLAAPVRPPLPLPAGAIVLRVVSFDDAAGRASQFIVSLPGAPARMLAQLCQNLLDRGWHPAGRTDCLERRPGEAQWFLRGTETLGLDLRADGAATRAMVGHAGPRP